MRSELENVLTITSEPPWPLNSGGHLRTFNLHNSLANHFNVHLICPVSRGKLPTLKLPQDSACTIECVTVDDRTLASETKRVMSAQLANLPYSMYRRHMWPVLLARWQQLISEAKPQYLWLDQIDSFQYHMPQTSGCKTVLDMHNIYSLILQRLAAECMNPIRRMAITTEAKRMERIETKACRAVDAVVAVSEMEAEHFKKLGAKQVWMAPNGVNAGTNLQSAARPVSCETPIILFLGAMDWQPNVSAAKYLACTVLPEIKLQYPQAILKLVGKDPVASVRNLAAIPGVTVTGTVPDIQPYLAEATVMAVPLESGGGTRLKILESFAAQLPVVSTQVGAEGIDANHGEHLIVAELEDIPRAIMSIFEFFPANSITNNALKLVRDKYDWSAIAADTARFLQNIP